MIALGIRHKDTLELCYTKGVFISGSPLGTPSFVKADLDKRLAKLDKTAETIESLVVAGSQGAPWQGLLQLVQQCVATINPHLARSLPPGLRRRGGSASESPSQTGQIPQTNGYILVGDGGGCFHFINTCPYFKKKSALESSR